VEAKARYWAVKIQQQWVVTPGKQTRNPCYVGDNVKYSNKLREDGNDCDKVLILKPLIMQY
jgi:hypothetical protein